MNQKHIKQEYDDGWDSLKKLTYILDSCLTNPDLGLEFIEMRKTQNPGVEKHPILRWVKVIALGGKGLFKALHVMNLSDTQLKEVMDWEETVFRRTLRITDEQLDYLEDALREVKIIEQIEPNFISMIGTDEDPVGNNQIDFISIALERCRPGKVQELMGTTKLIYFGSEHKRTGFRPGLELTRNDYEILWNTRFKASLIAKSAIAMDKGIDSKGRKFVTCLLYLKCIDEWKPDETLGTAESAGALYLFDDGSFYNSNDTKRVFVGAALPGMSLPPELK